MKRDNYFPKMIAALIVIAVALASLVYSLVKSEPSDENIEGLIIEKSDDGTILVNPSDDMPVPTSPPNITPPTAPPPNN